MGKLLSMCSSKRPERLREMIASWDKTANEPDSQLVIYVDELDPAFSSAPKFILPERVSIEYGPAKTLIQVNNYFCMEKYLDFDYYHEINDDHLCRTRDWDILFKRAIDEKNNGYSIAYGQTKNMPSSVTFGGKLVRLLGYMFPPTFRHSYIDNWLVNIAQGANLFRYVPEVVIEHMHPMHGKGPKDEIHKGVEADYDYGKKAYEAEKSLLPAIIKKIREVIAKENGTIDVPLPSGSAQSLPYPEDFGPGHRDWDNPGKAAWQQKWILANDPRAPRPAINVRSQPAAKEVLPVTRAALMEMVRAVVKEELQKQRVI